MHQDESTSDRSNSSHTQSRREFLRTTAGGMGAASLALSFPFTPATAAQDVEPLPGTEPLHREGDLSLEVVDRIDKYFLQQLEASRELREDRWNRDYSSPEAYTSSVAENRRRFRRIIGAVDHRVPIEDLQFVAGLEQSALTTETDQLQVYAVRWPVFENADAEGLLLEPRTAPKAQVVAVPDADQQPEELAGLADNPSGTPIARYLAEAGVRVLIPTVIDRNNTWSGNERIRMTNQTHREWIYRQAYFMGRHIIGYEVQKILAAVDWFEQKTSAGRIGVFGYGEGGLLALYAAALDERIDTALVSGYFREREHLWEEPVYRNVWGLLREFGDAEIAGLVAPRPLIIEACRGPEVDGPPPPRNGRRDAAPGTIVSPPLPSVRAEYERANGIYQNLGREDKLELNVVDQGTGPAGSLPTLETFLETLQVDASISASNVSPLDDRRKSFDPDRRMKRQVDQLVAHTQHLVAISPHMRSQFWSEDDRESPLRRSTFHVSVGWQETTSYSVEDWRQLTPRYREYFWEEIIGRMPPASRPPNARTRLIYETSDMKGYEVVMDVWPEVINYGILLVPKDITPDEERPVVVTQHGRAGRPRDVANPLKVTDTYYSFGAQLAERGFVVYAPQNLYIGEEKYRQLERKANPLERTFFAPMVRQHEQVLRWLGTLSFVDPDRIGFYGLSYGGKSAMIIPAILDGYSLSICSGDFNQYVWKHTSVQAHHSFMFTEEYEHTEFGIGEKFNYAELAGLIAPRPFMVERGHYDIVAPDEWVGYEYGRVRRLYADLRISERTQIEYFLGPHEIHGEATFDFLHEHLKWPAA